MSRAKRARKIALPPTAASAEPIEAALEPADARTAPIGFALVGLDDANFDSIAKNADLKVVHMVLPNRMHAECALLAARAGNHLVSEKPMANRAADCHPMIGASEKAGVSLMTAHRSPHEPHRGALGPGCAAP